MTEADQGTASGAQWGNRRARGRGGEGVNVGRTERLISGVAGAAAIGYGLRRRRLRALLLPLGVGLLRRAVTGRCEINRALGRNTAEGEGRSGPIASPERRRRARRIEQAVVISRPRDELFRFWRQLDNLPRFMDNLESVTVLDSRRSHWVAKGPAGTRVEWDAEIHNEIEDEIIGLALAPGLGGGPGRVGALHAGAHGGTEVRVVMRYAAPGGKAGPGGGASAGRRPRTAGADDLRRFKQVMEVHGSYCLHAGPGYTLRYDCIVVGGGAGRAERGTDARPMPPPRARVRYRPPRNRMVARGARVPHAGRHRARRAAADRRASS